MSGQDISWNDDKQNKTYADDIRIVDRMIRSIKNISDQGICAKNNLSVERIRKFCKSIQMEDHWIQSIKMICMFDKILAIIVFQ